jgi:hypothetical protein
VNAPSTPELPATLWHYTDAAGLLGILGHEVTAADPNIVGSGSYKPVLWASAAQFLNDRRELVHGLELVNNFVKDGLKKANMWASAPPTTQAPPGADWVTNSWHTLFNSTRAANPTGIDFLKEICRTLDLIIDRKYETYLHCCTVSFSQEPDVLSQWRAYGNGIGGFSIGFDPSKFPRSDGSPVHLSGLGLHEVQYTRNELTPALKTAVLELFTTELTRRGHSVNPGNLSTAVQNLAFYAASVKHQGFEEEHEWRFIEPGSFDAPEFRATPSGLVPYRKLDELPSDAVTGLYVGPGPKQYENLVAAKSLLQRYGYTTASANVHPSETPFR